jgi:hypothetical protein
MVKRYLMSNQKPYGFCLLIRYLLSIAFSFHLWFTASDYSLGICWPLYCLSTFDLRLLITLLVSSHFWPLYCLSFDIRLLITLLVSSHFWPLYWLSFDLCLLITLLVSSHFWSLYWLSFDLRLLITLLVSSHFWQSIQWPKVWRYQ